MARLFSSFKMPPSETQDWLNTKNYFNSYATCRYTSGPTPAFSDGFAEPANEFNPFQESLYDGNGTADVTVIKSPDVSFDETNGKFSVSVAGDYWVCWVVNFKCATSDTTAVAKIRKNDTSQIFVSEAIYVNSSSPGPTQVVCTQIVSLAAGDTIHGTLLGVTAGRNVSAHVGTSLTIMRVNGLYGHAKYTGAASALQVYGNVNVFDEDYGGTVVTETNGVTFNSDPGKFEPSETRIFLYLSTLISTVTTATECLEHKLTVNGSSTNLDQMTFGTTAGTDPSSHSVAILKEVRDDERAAIKRTDNTQTPAGCGNSNTAVSDQAPVAYNFRKGTNWSFIDISNDGGLPEAFLCGTLEKKSDQFTNNTTTTMTIYNEDNYDSGNDFDFEDPNDKADLGGNRNITLNSALGFFEPQIPGDYLVISYVGIQEVQASQACQHQLQQSGIVAIDQIESQFFQAGASNNFDPVNNIIVSIVRIDDQTNTCRVIPRLEGLQGRITDGTGIVFILLGPRMTKRSDDNEFFDGATRVAAPDSVSLMGAVSSTTPVGQPIVQTDDTINSADKGDQRDRRTEQSPFRMTVNGPLTLRGRARSSLPFNVAAGKRGGKK